LPVGAGFDEPGLGDEPGLERGGEGEPGHRVEQEQRPVGGDLPVAL
jgi:hypothetical protein